VRRRSVKRQQLQQQLHREWRRDSSSCTCVLWQQLPRLRQRCVTCGDRYANRCPPFIVEVGVFVRFVTIINRKTLYSCMLATSGCLNVSTATILCVRFSCSLKSAYRTTKFGAIGVTGPVKSMWPFNNLFLYPSRTTDSACTVSGNILKPVKRTSFSFLMVSFLNIIGLFLHRLSRALSS